MARELRRGATIDADIADAINTAVDAYRDTRFYWAESRTDAAFDTVALTEFYDKDSAGAAALGRLIIIDYVQITIGGQPFQLAWMRPDQMDAAAFGMSPGQPSYFTWYQERLRLYPMPAEAYPLLVAGTFSVAAPASDAEVNNPWMTKAERLIRSRAVLELALHRLRDRGLADDMSVAVEEAYSQLKGETNVKTGTSVIEPFW